MILKKYFIAVLLFFCIVSCKNKKNIPDVSAIKIELTIVRFEKDFFAIDTTNIIKAFDTLAFKYHSFLPDYLVHILGLNAQPDSIVSQTKLFLRDSLYNKIYKDASAKFQSLKEVEDELIFALKLTKHYFPKYKLPNKMITFVGPLDGVAVAPTNENGLAIGLQAFLGKDYPAYQNGYLAQTYPAYKTRRFEPQYIATNCIKTIIEELYPNKSVGQPLAERLIEEGRRLYMLDALLPNTADSIKTGYTTNQLDECFRNEKAIWNFFVNGNLLFEREPSKVSPYVTDGPKTQELSETAPGNIGQFTGWQIIKLWMAKNTTITLQQLMETPAMTIFNDVAYAP